MGSKLALFVGAELLVLQRDDTPGLLWPGYWDLAGGGREGGETPLGCALRELREEFGLRIPASSVTWGRAYTNTIGRSVWFFVGAVPSSARADIQFGNEGQGWDLMPVPAFLAHDRAVPQFQQRLKDYLSGVVSMGWSQRPPA